MYQLTLLEICICLHHAYSPEPFPMQNGVDYAERNLVEKGMLTRKNSCQQRFYDLTDKGAIYVTAIRNTPFPICVWQMPSTE